MVDSLHEPQVLIQNRRGKTEKKEEKRERGGEGKKPASYSSGARL